MISQIKRLFLGGFLFLLAACASPQPKSRSPILLVTVSPYQTFVERLVGNQAKVVVFVPPGVSGHSYEPSPKQTLEAAQALVWFRIGEPFEEHAIEAFQSHNPQMAVVDLRQGLKLLPHFHHHDHHDHDHDHDHDHHDHHHEEQWDTHLWLSPRLMEVQVAQMAQTLKNTFPDGAEGIDQRAQSLSRELRQLDEAIQSIWANSSIRAILVTHPAYSYYCQDYGVEQLSLEVEGKDPTPQQVTQLLKQIRARGIDRLFAQQEYAGKGARTVAATLNLPIITLNPFDPDYFHNMLTISAAFAGAAHD